MSKATEWFLIRGLDLCSHTLDRALEIRASLKKQGYRFYFTNKEHGVTILPPIAALETPLPVCLLALRSEHIFITEVPQSSAYQNQIVRVLKAQKRFSQHETTIANILLKARFREIHLSALRMLSECENTLTMLQHAFPDHGLGRAISLCIQKLGVIETGRAAVEEMKAQFQATHFSTVELSIQTSERIEECMILLDV